ncbi:MAG: UDP-N-acetylglucosamine 1-carboxyvinyltransferase [Brockia lithotrophica]|uniref:UDP-N-acetylglucosamine 1-carboxyvinyltransferase n=1 Tax=Brockia lithotrophica TaxID=933949 RepID=A0A2T5G8H1_9BACL|nr:UDP-N-acetylglucosamine 1-carboxyvinyltransferase [Brockia lithotrophica]PTQ52459.1 MAG: UDP-N-acetylglucosamine 1-carboxyvinyltransferase [Brockia lithotrophica]
MSHLLIEGGRPLVGWHKVYGAKNAVLPILAATVLARDTFEIENVPDLLDLEIMIAILHALGARVRREGTTLYVDTRGIHRTEVPEELMGQMRSSLFLMGPLVARYREATLYRPGGCAIGTRRIDFHVEGLRRLGARVVEDGGKIEARALALRGATIVLPYPSVGATENLMMAATLAEGTTRIVNAAREPEIEDLGRFLNAMGARVYGAGEATIVVEGVRELRGTRHRVIPDRIVAGTFLFAAAITGGDVVLEDARPEHMEAVLDLLATSGVELEVGASTIRLRGKLPPRPLPRVVTAPHPGFPTDLQPQLVTYLTQAEGTSVVVETVFDGRFRHAEELVRMGARIYVDQRTAVVEGPARLKGERVRAYDLRGGAALVLAGLAAEGATRVYGLMHIDRGYMRLEEELAALGASVRRVSAAREEEAAG